MNIFFVPQGHKIQVIKNQIKINQNRTDCCRSDNTGKKQVLR